ncbi:MAG: hypothetical protein DI537_58255, partial [Stutzerimonas stutzeri]
GDDTEIVATLRDVTARRAAESAMRRTLAQLSESNRLLLMAEHMAGLGHWRLETGSQEVSWSDEIYRIYGRQPGEPIHVTDGVGAYHPDDRAAVTDAVRRSTENGEPLQFRARIVRPDGELRYVQCQGQAEWARGGTVSGVFGVIQDITDQTVAEAALVAAKEQAEAEARSRSDFLAVMSHEIRTPMTGVVAMLELLTDERMAGDRQATLASIRQSAQTLMAVLDDVLDHAKIEQGKLDLEAVDFDLAALVRDAAELFRARAAAKNIEILCVADDAIPVCGDPVRTQQILSNFVSNAIKFTGSGTIGIACRRTGEDRYRLEVRDSGVGISADALPHLFEAFTQADRSTTRRFGGSGLGLHIVRRLAERMGGTVGVESTLGEGSLFWA